MGSGSKKIKFNNMSGKKKKADVGKKEPSPKMMRISPAVFGEMVNKIAGNEIEIAEKDTKIEELELANRELSDAYQRIFKNMLRQSMESSAKLKRFKQDRVIATVAIITFGLLFIFLK